MIIFGWGHQTRRDFGPVAKLNCSHCGNDDYWTLLRSTTWATLFFIPVLPYSIEKFLLCPICKYGVPVDDKKFNEFRTIAEANQSLVDGRITESDHARILGYNTSDEIETKQEISAVSEQNASKFCHSCGKETKNDANFCKFCGNKLI